MVDNYNGRRDAILRIYAEYISFKGQYRDNIKVETLEQRASNIRDGKFFLIVAGEAKSGKSTFINAFLGAEILPMDVKQCTSALIEINYGTEITLEAEYADGRKSSKLGQECVQQFLQEHAAINDDYRAIPVTAINNEILIKSKGQIRESEVKDLIEGVKNDNIFNLSPEDYEKCIWRYINEKKNKWQDIVIRINITYPFLTEMREITIVDSPGVNAAGKVGSITNEYIIKADAIIFVKALKGQSLESLSFRNFLNSNVLDRSKGALLLLLTQKSDLEDNEIYELKTQAVKMYRGFIKENHITEIDSKIQLFYHRFAILNEGEIDNQLDGIKFSAVKICWLETKNRKEFLERLQKESGFKAIDTMLDEFARKAHNQRLYDFLDLIGKGYETIMGNIKEELSLLESSAEDPAQLKFEIEKREDEIEELKLKMHKGIDTINREYTDYETGLIKRKAEEEFEKFRQELSATQGFDSVEKKTLNGQDMFLHFREEVRLKLINDCDCALIEITDKTSIPVESVIPILTKEDFDKVKEETKQLATEDETYTTGACWWKETQHRSVYSEEKHLDFIREKILRTLETTKDQMINSLFDDVNIVTKLYGEELRRNTDNKQSEYDELVRRMTSVEEIRRKTEALSQDQGIISEKTQELHRIKGGIESEIG
jgi:GTPase SAR1 family protein